MKKLILILVILSLIIIVFYLKENVFDDSGDSVKLPESIDVLLAYNESKTHALFIRNCPIPEYDYSGTLHLLNFDSGRDVMITNLHLVPLDRYKNYILWLSDSMFLYKDEDSNHDVNVTLSNMGNYAVDESTTWESEKYLLNSTPDKYIILKSKADNSQHVIDLAKFLMFLKNGGTGRNVPTSTELCKSGSGDYDIFFNGLIEDDTKVKISIRSFGSKTKKTTKYQFTSDLDSNNIEFVGIE